MRRRWFGRAVLARVPMLMIGLVLFGAAIALMVRSELGLSPWETLHLGITHQTAIPIGTVSILLGIPILLLWLPLGERPGIGTLLNIITIGTSTNVALAFIPETRVLPAQVALEVAGICLFGLATGIYLAAGLGPGPRDGLFTAVHRRFGWRITWIRTAIELTVLVVGFALGGTVGLGTVAFALAIGPLTELSLRVFDRHGRVIRRRRRAGAEPVPAEGAA
jgi:uncharacterized membrane protein YczE